MSGPTLAARLGISQPFLSQVETGRRSPRVELTEKWYDECLDAARARLEDDQLTVRQHREVAAAVNKLDTDQYRAGLVRLAEDVNTEVVSSYVITRTGLAQRQREIQELDAKAKRILHFQPLIVPGPLQTREYAELVFAGHARSEAMGHMSEDERAAVLAAAHDRRMLRAKALTRPDSPAYEAIVAEQALDVRLAGSTSDTRRTLAHHILTLAAAPQITIRVLSADAEYDYVPLGAFLLYEMHDESGLVLVETYAAQVAFSAPRDVRLHHEAWRQLSAAAMTAEETITWLAERSK